MLTHTVLTRSAWVRNNKRFHPKIIMNTHCFLMVHLRSRGYYGKFSIERCIQKAKSLPLELALGFGCTQKAPTAPYYFNFTRAWHVNFWFDMQLKEISKPLVNEEEISKFIAKYLIGGLKCSGAFWDTHSPSLLLLYTQCKRETRWSEGKVSFRKLSRKYYSLGDVLISE